MGTRSPVVHQEHTKPGLICIPMPQVSKPKLSLESSCQKTSLAFCPSEYCNCLYYTLSPTNNAAGDTDRSLTSWDEAHSPGRGETTLKSCFKKKKFCPQTRLVLQPLGLEVSSSGSPNLAHVFLSTCQDSTLTIL